MIRVHDLSMETRPGMAKVTFYTEDINEVDQIRSKWRDKPLKAEIKPIRQGRSKDANAFLWKMCQEIAEAIHSTRTEVYRHAIREVGVFDDLAIQRKALRSYINHWTEQGIGWQVDVFESDLIDKRGDSMKRIRVYYGSSTYDTKEMSVLIDYIVDQAKELDIPTETPNEIARMKALWKGGE